LSYNVNSYKVEYYELVRFDVTFFTTKCSKI